MRIGKLTFRPEAWKLLWLCITLAGLNDIIEFYYLKPLTYLMLAAGAVMLLADVGRRQHCKKSYGFVFLFLFVLSYAISCILNWEYSGLKDMVSRMAWLIITFFVIYPSPQNTDIMQIKKYFGLFCNCVIAASFLFTLISLAMFFMKIGGTLNYYKGERAIYGIYVNRLWGYYFDPNFGAVFSIVSVICCYYKAGQTAVKRPSRWFIRLNFVIQYVYIALSVSRTATLSILLIIFLLLMSVLMRFAWVNQRKTVALVILLAFSLIWMPSVRSFSTKLANQINYQGKTARTGATTGAPKTPAQPKSSRDYTLKVLNYNQISTQREDTKTEDLSNGRVQIWKSALELFLARPLFGITHTGFLSFAEDNLPDTFIARTGKSIHNDYIKVLMASGIVGAVFFGCFIFEILQKCGSFLMNRQNEGNKPLMRLFSCLFLIVGVLALGGMTLDCFMFTRHWFGCAFWLVLGWMAQLIKSSRESGTEEQAL